MDPNDQPPAGPDAPDKETMEQVRRPCASSQSPLMRADAVFVRMLTNVIDPGTAPGQAGQALNAEAGGEQAGGGYQLDIITSTRGKRGEQDQDQHHTGGGLAGSQPLRAAGRRFEHAGRGRREPYRYYLPCCSQEVRLPS